MNNLNLSQDKINALLGMASKELGQSPEQIKSQLEQGKVDNLIQNMDDKTKKQVNGLLSNPKALEALMGNDKVKGLLSNLMGGQK